MGYNLKDIRKEFSEKGIFYTDVELARFIKSFIPNEAKEVYDPTCGDGALLSVFDETVKKYGQEINGEQLEAANSRLSNFEGYCGDTLKNPNWFERKFDAIVANPPFSIAWEPWVSDARIGTCPTVPTASKADYAFILHILYMLSENGVAAVLNFPGVLYRGGREGTVRKWLIENNFVDKVVYVEGNKFVDTAISTVLLVLRKNKVGDSVEFINEKGDKKIINKAQIAENDYSLATNLYFPVQNTKEDIDPISVEMLARKGFLRKMRAELLMSKFASDREGLDFSEFVIQIKQLIEEVEKSPNLQV